MLEMIPIIIRTQKKETVKHLQKNAFVKGITNQSLTLSFI